MDPTRTGGLRRKFVASLRRQFSRLKVEVMKFVGEGNAFGVTANAFNPDQPRDNKGEWSSESIVELKSNDPEELPWSGDLPVPGDWRSLTSDPGRLAKTTLRRVEDITPSETSSRQAIDAMKEWISDKNNDLPPIVVERNEKGFDIVDGNTRYIAAKELGYKKIPVREHLSITTNAGEFQFHSDAFGVTANSNPEGYNQYTGPGSEHIGREWKNGRGELRKVVGGMLVGSEHRLRVQTGESPNHELIKPEELEEEIKRDTHRYLHVSEKEKPSRTETHHGFTDSMTPMHATKAKTALSVGITSGGILHTRKSLVEKLVGEGATVVQTPKERRLSRPDGTYLSEKQISKTAMDYAKHLTENPTVNAGEFQFHSDPDKVEAFQQWLRAQLASFLVGKTEEELWTRFIEAGFQKGCVLGDTLINGAVIKTVFKRQYSGSIVEIETASGRKISVTPNHPMLTELGWVAANAIKDGDNLVCAARSKGVSSSDPDVQGAPTSISEIFDSLSVLQRVERVVGDSVDFHGDGMEGEVNILSTDGKLVYGVFTPVDKHSAQFLFPNSGQSPGRCFGTCGTCGYSVGDKCVCFALTSQIHSTSNKPLSNSVPITPEITRDRRKGLSRDVPLNDLVGNDVGSEVTSSLPVLTSCQSSFGETSTDASRGCDTVNSPLSTPDCYGDLLLTETGKIELDNVISLTVREFCGHVYNLETEHGYYVANSLYTKNCGRAFDDANVAERALKYGGDEDLDFYDGTREEFLRSSFGRPVAVEKVKLLAGRSFDELENVTADMSNKMSRVLVDGLVQGRGPRDIARDMTKEVDVGLYRATVIARSEIVRAHSEGQLEAFENLGIKEVGAAIEFSSSEDDRVCPACEALEGVVLKIDEAHGIIPVHPNCLPGDCFVASVSRIAAASKRWYDGNLIVIETASGRKLSCTPNHPVLTDRGWIPARFLDISSNVVSDGASDWEVPIKNHYQNVPTSIHEVSEALRRSPVVSSREVPVTAPDFHGDGLGSEIAVVWTDGELRRKDETAELEHRPKSQLIFGCLRRMRRFLTSKCRKTFRLQCLRSASNSVMCCGRLFTSRFCIHTGPLKVLRFRLTTTRNTCQHQSALNDPTRNAKPLGNSVLGFPIEICGDDFLVRKSGVPARSVFSSQNAHNDFTRDAELARKISDGSTGPVFLDKVVSTVVEQFHGHVYNLETEEGFFTANGIITHNCRCAWTPANVGEGKEDRDAQKNTKKEIDRAFRQARETVDDVEPGARISKSRPESVLNIDYFVMEKNLEALLEQFSDSQRVDNYNPDQARDEDGKFAIGGMTKDNNYHGWGDRDTGGFAHILEDSVIRRMSKLAKEDKTAYKAGVVNPKVEEELRKYSQLPKVKKAMEEHDIDPKKIDFAKIAETSLYD